MNDERDAPCFKRGVDPEGNPWCDFQDGHDGLCSDHAGESMGRFVLWRESDVDDNGNVRPLAVSDVVNPPSVRCPTCIHPEGYDRLSGPCSTCGGDGVIPPGAPQ